MEEITCKVKQKGWKGTFHSVLLEISFCRQKTFEEAVLWEPGNTSGLTSLLCQVILLLEKTRSLPKRTIALWSLLNCW